MSEGNVSMLFSESFLRKSYFNFLLSQYGLMVQKRMSNSKLPQDRPVLCFGDQTILGNQVHIIGNWRHTTRLYYNQLVLTFWQIHRLEWIYEFIANNCDQIVPLRSRCGLSSTEELIFSSHALLIFSSSEVFFRKVFSKTIDRFFFKNA